VSAKRFGGEHSPGGKPNAAPDAPPPASRFSGRKARSFSWRVLGLYIAPSGLILPGLEGLFTADMAKVLWAVCPYILLILSAWLTGQGMKAEVAYNERTIAKPPAFPRKTFASALTGASLFIVCWLGIDLHMLIAMFYGALGVGAHLATFGFDPMKAKGGVGLPDAELDRVAAKLDQAEQVVEETASAANGLRDRGLDRRIDALAYAARDILKEIQNDPRDLRRARKFLSVHLIGLRDATQKFANAKSKGVADDMRGEYEALLADLETSFAKQRKSLLIDDRVDLEVEIEVLRDRLKQEGAL